ncbi:senecionine N-oxygenase [Anabrus simplex]|uniref:senecionine N-oxygenase n=1 Tax=Anabrus simplex TaxID=316456 RepID=UPI0035A3D231
MHVAVIGAGAAGLASARQITDTEGHTCIVFEQAAVVGGTWVYTDMIGLDEFGYPVHTSMYKNLRTNLPKEVMGFPDFPIKKEEDRSYIPAEDILQFLNDYADHFKLRKYIQFFQRVRSVVPVSNQWDVTVEDVRTKETRTMRFDAVMVCNGHYWKPRVPQLLGADDFQGTQIHSHDYRRPEAFRGKRVLVIGAGPSGMDLTLELSTVAEQVILSHHLKEHIATRFPPNVTQKPDVKCLTEWTAEFQDGSSADIDTVLYCTGFRYDFPFLDEKCKVRVEDNHVRPLYKHFIHIEYNTLCFIGLPYYVCAFQLFDLQARFFVSTLSGRVKLPPPEDMEEDYEQEMLRRKAAGLSRHQFHMMGPLQGAYYDDLADSAQLPRLPPVMASLHNESSRRFLEDLAHYREDIYRIVDENTYIQVK